MPNPSYDSKMNLVTPDANSPCVQMLFRKAMNLPLT